MRVFVSLDFVGLERPISEVNHNKRNGYEEYRHYHAARYRVVVHENGRSDCKRRGNGRYDIRRDSHVVYDKVRQYCSRYKEHRPKYPHAVAHGSAVLRVNVLVKLEEQRKPHVEEQYGRNCYYEPSGNGKRNVCQMVNSAEYARAIRYGQARANGCEHAYPKQYHARNFSVISYNYRIIFHSDVSMRRRSGNIRRA